MDQNPLQVDVSPYDHSVGDGRSGMNPWVRSTFVNTYSQDTNAMPELFQEKTPFMSSSVLGATNGDCSSLRDRGNLLGMQQKPGTSSRGVVPLDPLEEKILYHMDDSVHDSSFGRNDNEISSGGFSLSALMQCALAEETDPVDGNGNGRIPNVCSFTSSLENACTDASWMKQSCLASPPSSVHPFPGESEMSGMGCIKGQTHKQEISNSSLPSQPSDLSSYEFCMNTPIGQHRLVGAPKKFPLTFPTVPSEVHNAPPNVLPDGSSSFCFSKSSFSIHQNPAIVEQPQHNEFDMEYLKTDDGPVGETRSNVSNAITDDGPFGDSVGNYVEKSSANAWHPDIGLSDSAVQCLDAVNQNMDSFRQKKRKSVMFSQSPWHNVVLQGSDMRQSISFSEQKWALATNRLLETVEDKVSPSEPIPPSKRRLILSTRLMQQLLPPAPSCTLSGNFAVCYDSVVCFVARVALGEACGLTCYGLNSLYSHSDMSGKIFEEIVTLEKDGDEHQRYAQVGKVFIEKIQKLESDFKRLDETMSIVDIVVEIQDTERFSVINRFAKFHSRVQAYSSSSSSSSPHAMSKSVPQRYVTGLPMPKILPEGVHCLPL